MVSRSVVRHECLEDMVVALESRPGVTTFWLDPEHFTAATAAGLAVVLAELHGHWQLLTALPDAS